jgi:hypothetical protein
MIIFDLSCEQGHRFEGWFQSQSAYDAQFGSRLIACPHCGSTEIRRVPSAVHLATTTSSTGPKRDLTPQTQTGMLAVYKQLMSVIVSNSVDVGTSFAQEARKIHYKEVPQRSIHGQASTEEFEDLCEEGIRVLCLPIVKNEDLN